MQISKLEYQKKNPNRVNLFINGAYYCSLEISSVADYKLFQGKDVTEEVIQEVLYKDLILRLKDRAITYLSASLKTERMIRDYLKRTIYKKKGLWFKENIVDTDEIVEKVMDELKRLGMINDESFAVAFVESRLRTRPRSKYMLENELISKGVYRKLAQKVCGLLIKDDLEVIKELYEKKFGNAPLTKNDTKKINFLRGKGFNWDTISKLITETESEVDDVGI